MKKGLLLLAFFVFLAGSASFAQNEFITTWKTDNVGVSGTTEITIPTTGTGYNYDVDWDNDGTFDEIGLTGDVTHDFGTAGTYTIRIQGNFPRIYFNNGGDELKILDVSQWGNIQWTSMQESFFGCENLTVTATDSPDLTGVTSLESMFRRGFSFNSDISGWNVSTITNMSHAFRGCIIFNQPLDSWNIGNVQYMESMFDGANDFNQPLNSWNTGNVIDMYHMFYNNYDFDQNLSNWNVSSVTSMDRMFRGVILSVANYDSLLVNWGAQTLQSNVNFGDGGSLYCAGTDARDNMINNFGWTITDGGQSCIGDEFILTVKTDNSGTSGTTEFTIPTTGSGYDYNVDWDNDGVMDEYGITGSITHDFTTAGTYTIRILGDFPRIYFNNSGDKLKALEIAQWGNIEWQSMSRAFYGCEDLVITATDIPDLNGTTSMYQSFRRTSVNTGFENWNVSTIENMDRAFYDAFSMNGNISGWNVSNVTTFQAMFLGTPFNQNISSWITSSAQDMIWMFFNTPFNQDISGWDVSNVYSMDRMFYSCNDFDQDLNGWITTSLTSTSETFLNATSFDQNLGNWDMSSVTNATDMFLNTAMSVDNYDSTLIGWNAQTLQTGVALGAGSALYCNSVDERANMIASDGWTITDGGQSCIGDEFILTVKTDNSGTSGTTEFTIPTNGAGYNYNVDWDNDGIMDEYGITGSITHDFATAGTYTIRILGDFPSIYFNNGGDRLKALDVSQWGNIEWESMSRAFYGCNNLDITATDTPDLSGVTLMDRAFRECDILVGTNMVNWDVSSIMVFHRTFEGCNVFDAALDNWDMGSATDISRMFINCPAFNQPLNNWNVANVQYFQYTFNGCGLFNQDLNNWNTSTGTAMFNMFSNCGDFNGNVTTWNTSNVTSFDAMFTNAISFDQDLSDWDVTSVTTASNMFDGVTLSTDNYDSLLIGWDAQTLQTGVSFDAGNSIFCAAFDERANMISSDGWTITDGGQSCIGDEFILTVKTDNSGTSGTTEFTIPTNGAGYNYNLDWDNDGIMDEYGITGSITHDFATAGTYTIRILGDFPSIRFNNGGDREKLISVDQWGANEWTTMEAAFYGCTNMDILATDVIDLSGVSSMYQIFRACETMNAPLDAWDVSTVTNMAGAFQNATSFDQPLTNWDVSNVTNMTDMFRAAIVFNGDISTWNTSAVTSMGRMFRYTWKLDQDLGGWNTGLVTDMSSMFEEDALFNADLSGWDVSHVTNMNSMFRSASSFDRNLGSWAVDSLLNAASMFNNITLSTDNYDSLLIGWNAHDLKPGVSFSGGNSIFCAAFAERANMITNDGWTITDGGQSCIGDEFIITIKTDNSGTSGTTEFTIPTNGAGYNYNVDWDNDGIMDEYGITGNVTHDFTTAGTYTIRILGSFPKIYFDNGNDGDKLLSIDQWGAQQWSNWNYSFAGCDNLIITATDNPDLSVCSGMNFAFSAAGIVGNVSGWDVSNVSGFAFTFANTSNFNGDITGWDVSNAGTLSGMFVNAPLFNQDISGWNLSGVSNVSDMFRNAIAFDQNLSAWDMSAVTNAADMFENVTLSISNYDAMLTAWNAQTLQSGVVFDGGNSFYCAAAADHADLIASDGWVITDLGQSCSTDPYIITVKTDNTGTSGTTEFTIPTNGSGYNYHVDWDNDGTFDEYGLTGNVTHDFGTSGTYTIRIEGDFPRIYFNNGGDKSKLIDIAQWGTINWSSMADAFYGCDEMNMSATDVPDLSSVTSLSATFRACTQFTGDVSNWNVSTINNMSGTFFDAFSFSGDVSSWDVSNVNTMWAMFLSTDMNANISGWDVSNVGSFAYMFQNNDVFNQDISNWNTQSAGNMQNMFSGSHAFDQNLGDWDVSGVTNMGNFFGGGNGLSIENYDSTLIGWSSQALQSGVSFSGGNSMFCTAYNERSDIISNFSWTITDAGQSCIGDEFILTVTTDNAGNSGTTEFMIPTTGTGYNYNVDWDNDGVMDEYGITGDITHDFTTAGTYTIRILGDFPRIYFNATAEAQKVVSIDQWGKNSWTSMQGAFWGCLNMNVLATDAPDLSNVSEMQTMFRNCTLLDADLNSWDVSNVTSMVATFRNCDAFNTSINSWNVANVENTRLMFAECALFNQDLSGWNTGSVEEFNYMFQNNTVFNQDISGWNTSSATTMVGMFDGATAFDQDLGSWNISNVTNASDMFGGVTLSTNNYDNLLIGWGAQTLQANVIFDGGNSKYCAGEDARAAMIANDNWSITDGGVDDTTAPVADLATLPDVTETCEVTTLTAPTATDNCASSVTVTNDVTLPITLEGTTVVTWTYDDGHGNTSTQMQNVVIDDITAPVPDQASLADLIAECELASLTAPTATDECADSVIVTNDANLPLTNGATLVTWTYDDGHGNTTTQTQLVLVYDVTAPVPDSTTLPDIIAICDVPFLLPPTATDDCAANVIVTNDAVLPLLEGTTTVVTWTYDDGHGNTVTQTQNVIVDDVTAPVPDSTTLTDIVATCEVSSLTAPTATDECAVEVMVTNDVVFPLLEGTTTVVTWTYDDGHGNTVTQTQNVIVDDVTAPTPDMATLSDVVSTCEVNALTTPTATDECASSVTVTNDAVLPITTTGTTVVTWTYDDGHGNTTTQTQNVVITGVDVSTSVAGNGIVLIASTSLGTYQWIDCNDNSIIAGETNQSYDVTVNGSYAVIVDQDGCVDTSDCILVSTVGIAEVLETAVNVYPNPVSNGSFSIETDQAIDQVNLVDLLGRTIEVDFDTNTGIVNASKLPSGKYFVHILMQDQIAVKEIVVVN